MTAGKDRPFGGRELRIEGDMAKRLTDTEKFIDPWFRRLSSKNKLLWDWLLCNCDHAGIITVDLEFVEMVLGERYEDDVMSKYFSDRVIPISEGKFFIPKFLKFQYGKLNPKSKVHASVIARLEDEGILLNGDPSIKAIENNALSIGYGYSMDTDKDKEKAKDKNKAKEKEKASEKNLPEILPQDFRNSKGVKPDALIQRFNDTLAGKGKVKHCRGLSGADIQEFLTTTSYAEFSKIETWDEVFQNAALSPFLLGQERSSWVVTLNWLVKHENALKVLNGAFNGGGDGDLETWALGLKLEA